MKSIRTVKIDESNKADEIKPGLWAIRQRSVTVPGRVTTIYLTSDMLIWLADEIKHPTDLPSEPILIGSKP